MRSCRPATTGCRRSGSGGRSRRTSSAGFLFAIYALDTLPLDFDPALWTATVDHVTVHADDRLVFRFRNGAEVEEEIEDK